MNVKEILKTTNEIATICKIYLNFTQNETPEQQNIYLRRKLKHKTFIYTEHLLLVNYQERAVTVKHRATNIIMKFDLKRKEIFQLHEIVKDLDYYIEFVEELTF